MIDFNYLVFFHSGDIRYIWNQNSTIYFHFLCFIFKHVLRFLWTAHYRGGTFEFLALGRVGSAFTFIFSHRRVDQKMEVFKIIRVCTECSKNLFCKWSSDQKISSGHLSIRLESFDSFVFQRMRAQSKNRSIYPSWVRRFLGDRGLGTDFSGIGIWGLGTDFSGIGI